MFLEQKHKTVAKLFGVEAFNPYDMYEIKDDRGQIVERFKIRSYWIAQVTHFQPRRPGDEVIVAIVQTWKWRKGILLVPPLKWPSDEQFVGPKPLKTVDLAGWDDPVLAALKSIDLFPEDTNNQIRETWSYSYTIEFMSEITYGNLGITTVADKNQSLIKLWGALTNTIRHLADVYDDAQMREYISLS